MAQRYPYVADLTPEIKVPYGAVPRPDRGKWELRFNDRSGSRKRILTTQDVRGKTPPHEFHDEAKKHIKQIFCPPILFPELTAKTWNDLLEEVKKLPQIREMTINSFERSIRAFKEVMPEIESPADVSDERVRRFGKLWLAGDNKKYPGVARSPVTLSYYVRALSAFYNHLFDLGYVSRNPWKGFKVPKTEKKRKPVPTEAATSDFFTWLTNRYPDWKSLHALIELKAISACRTADVCQLKTTQLRDGCLTFTADITKTKEDRSLPLPDDLFTTLKELAGKEYLWENLYQECRTKRKGRGRSHMREAFSWKSIYSILNNIFREYNDEHPDQPRFTPHALRRRAITLTVKATGSVDAAATAIGVHAVTAKTHYLDAQRAFETHETMKKVANVLRPKRHQKDTKSGRDE
jgi:integrase